ncbi:uncharacterized protein LOC143623428 [Bidens hawaiensis]|uniref:uncharacterized protein LOC143623428 n=1 Tax=Bidens hawaiensis TaxID=980011 RepID=UPI00404B501A
MRCKKHFTDLSSTVGVCACCLRERLLSLISTQQQLQNSENIPSNIPANPRLVSPHFNSRKSDHSAADHRKDPRHHHSLSYRQFYRTPPVVASSAAGKKKRSFIRFISFTKNIFRSRNRKPVDPDPVSDPRAPDSTFGKSRGGETATSSSWFSSVISGSRRRRKPIVSTDESTVSAGAGPVRRRDKGMSPVRSADVISVDENESTESWKNTPRRTPAVRRGGSGGHARNNNMSGLTFCLSPLVRASPNLQLINQKGLPPDVVFSGEIGGPVKPHLSSTKSYGANRSRKLADFGRTSLNR